MRCLHVLHVLSFEAKFICMWNKLIRNTATLFWENDKEDFYSRCGKLNDSKGLKLL